MFPNKLLSRNPHSIPSKLLQHPFMLGSMEWLGVLIAIFLTLWVSDWIYMTQSQKANDLQIKPFDETTIAPTNPTQASDPRAVAFLERLKAKAEALDATQRENHVTAKEPRRRPIVEQSANPDWYQPQPAKKSAPPTQFVKRFVSAPKNKAKTG